MAREAIFFLATNTLIVFGGVAFDNAVAIYQLNPSFSRPSTSDASQIAPPRPASASSTPGPLTLIQALLLPTSSYDEQRAQALAQAIDRLKKKSRSFYLASSVFTGLLREDLVLL